MHASRRTSRPAAILLTTPRTAPPVAICSPVVVASVPVVEGGQWFRKVGTRAAQAISKVVMAAVRGDRPRISIGSVAPTVLRLRGTEEALAGGASIEDAQAVLMREVTPIDDIRSTAEYRLRPQVRPQIRPQGGERR